LSLRMERFDFYAALSRCHGRIDTFRLVEDMSEWEDNMGFTKSEKRRAVLRELALRKRVYPRLVAQGRMKQEDADR